MSGKKLLPEDNSEIKMVPDESRSAWFRHSDPWRVDHRRTCQCGHRYKFHTEGRVCWADFCGCLEWVPA